MIRAWRKYGVPDKYQRLAYVPYHYIISRKGDVYQYLPDEVMQLCLNRHNSEIAMDTMSDVARSVENAIEAATEGISKAHPEWKFESLEFTEGPFVSVLPNLDDGFPPENYYIVGFKIKSVPSTSQNPSESDDAYIVSPMRLGDAHTMEDEASFLKKGGETTEQKPN